MVEGKYRPEIDTEKPKSLPFLEIALDELVWDDSILDDEERKRRANLISETASTSELMALADKWGYGDLQIIEKRKSYFDMARRRKRVEIAESILTKKGVDPAEFYRGRRKNRLVRLAKRVGISREEFLRMIDEAYNEDEQNEFKS